MFSIIKQNHNPCNDEPIHPYYGLSYKDKAFQNILDILNTGNFTLINSILSKYPFQISKLKHSLLEQNILFFLNNLQNKTVIIPLALHFIKLGVNPLETDSNGQTCLFYACSKGQFEYVKFLIEQCNLDINQKDKFGQNALFYAATGGYCNITRYLIWKGAEINGEDCLGQSCLFFTVLNKQYETTNILINAGADVNHRDHNGYGLIEMCDSFKLKKMKRMLIKKGARKSKRKRKENGVENKEIKCNNDEVSNFVSLIEGVFDNSKAKVSSNYINTTDNNENNNNNVSDDYDDEFSPINGTHNKYLQRKRYILVKEIEPTSSNLNLKPLTLPEITFLKDKYPQFRELLYT